MRRLAAISELRLIWRFQLCKILVQKIIYDKANKKTVIEINMNIMMNEVYNVGHLLSELEFDLEISVSLLIALLSKICSKFNITI